MLIKAMTSAGLTAAQQEGLKDAVLTLDASALGPGLPGMLTDPALGAAQRAGANAFDALARSIVDAVGGPTVTNRTITPAQAFGLPPSARC